MMSSFVFEKIVVEFPTTFQPWLIQELHSDIDKSHMIEDVSGHF
jgi:hypothetical protein